MGRPLAGTTDCDQAPVGAATNGALYKGWPSCGTHKKAPVGKGTSRKGCRLSGGQHGQRQQVRHPWRCRLRARRLPTGAAPKGNGGSPWARAVTAYAGMVTAIAVRGGQGLRILFKKDYFTPKNLRNSEVVLC
ncbi:hypothetical protein BHE74_00042467 [Ensete ventricosum]|nr:hypothetical protein GW17_00039580 [Ensete ventricosum]RWW51204.1 hypothetical protein BHE74_00042467 [Ensete ventricosum]